MNILFVVAFLLLYIIGLPLIVLIHETGHALGLICSSKDGVARIHLGDLSNSNKENLRLGRIHFHIVWGLAGFCYYKTSNNISKPQGVVFMLGGPLISAILALFLYFLLRHPINTYLDFFITGMFWLNLSQFIFTIIPIIYPKWWGPYGGMASDGSYVLQFLKKD